MRYAKAAVGALIAGLGTLATALSDGSVEQVEWVWVAIAFLTALGGIWAVPNGSTPPTAGERADFEERLVAGNVKKVGFTGGGQSGILPPPTTRATGAPRLGGDVAPPD